MTTTTAPGTRTIRTTTLTSTTDLNGIPPWAAEKLAAEKATEPGVLAVEVITPDGASQASYTALIGFAPTPGHVDLEAAFLTALGVDPYLYCTDCHCEHAPSVQCPGPCPDCEAEAGQSCMDTCPNRYENPGE